MFLITILVILLIEQPRVYQSEVDMNHHKISWERALVSGLTDVFFWAILIQRNVFNNHGFRVLQKFWVPSTGSHSNHHLGWLNQQLCSWKIIMGLNLSVITILLGLNMKCTSNLWCALGASGFDPSLNHHFNLGLTETIAPAENVDQVLAKCAVSWQLWGKPVEVADVGPEVNTCD